MAIPANSRFACILPIRCPKLYQEFQRGNVGVQISGREFSRIHYGQAHEQSNAKIKSMKGPIDFVNRASNEFREGWRSQDPKLSSVWSKP